jgi:hypothetical protein
MTKIFREHVGRARIEIQEYGKCYSKIPILLDFYLDYGFKI